MLVTTLRRWLYRDRPYMTAREQAERVADYFAACLLMPKRVVKRLWFQGPQSVEELAEKLQVSPAAVRYRLYQLGLIEKASRCEWRSTRFSTVATRSRPALVGAVGGRQ